MTESWGIVRYFNCKGSSPDGRGQWKKVSKFTEKKNENWFILRLNGNKPVQKVEWFYGIFDYRKRVRKIKSFKGDGSGKSWGIVRNII